MVNRESEVGILEAFQEIRLVMGVARLAIILGSATAMTGVGSLRWNQGDRSFSGRLINASSKAMIAVGLAVGGVGVAGEIAGRQILRDVKVESLERIDARDQEERAAKERKAAWYRQQEGLEEE